jgi:hypothetical protein
MDFNHISSQYECPCHGPDFVAAPERGGCASCSVYYYYYYYTCISSIRSISITCNSSEALLHHTPASPE